LDRPALGHRKTMPPPSFGHRRKCPPTPTEVSRRAAEPSASITQTSRRPLRSDSNAMARPSGEKNGLMSSDLDSVKASRAPESRPALQMLGEPERDEKKTRALPSGDQVA